MSGTFYDFGPVTLDPIRASVTAVGRGLNATYDLGSAGDYLPSASGITITISRQDGAPIVSGNDLTLAGLSHPTTLDSTGLIIGFWLSAPAAAAGSTYVVTVEATSAQGEDFKRDAYITVLALMG